MLLVNIRGGDRAVETPICDFGWRAPDFRLPATDGKIWSLADVQGPKGTLIIFICNHCPYVLLIKDRLAELAVSWIENGVAVLAISSNDVKHYPADAPDKMTEFALANRFEFPYLFDESQQVAKAYKAACTPDFFFFNKYHQLFYRGQFDGSRPGNGIEVTGNDLSEAVEALVSGHAATTDQKASMGCNIKWRPGNEPDYF